MFLNATEDCVCLTCCKYYHLIFVLQGKGDEAIHYDDKAVEELLDRTKMGIEQKENWSNEYLSSFKVASYVTKEEEEVCNFITHILL